MATSKQSIQPPLAVYVHWPYCARICPYCDFNVYKTRADTTLIEAILQDLSYWQRLTPQHHITSIHFGGGTPSLMKAGDVAQIIHKVRALWTVANNIEIALEANPSDADKNHWIALSKAGVNRLSLGVQSFDADVLKKLGRDHDDVMAHKAAKLAKDIFPSVSLDLIFGHKDQSAQDWEIDLNHALSYAPNHISTYQLTIEEGTAFAKAEARGDSKAVDSDISADRYEQVRLRLTQAGYDHYEVSNFAKMGNTSKHNLSYWKGHDYVGVGPGAHGRYTKNGVRYAAIAAMQPKAYTASVKNNGTGVDHTEALSKTAQGEEYVMMGLRISEGLSLSRFENITGNTLPEGIIEHLVQMELLNQDGDIIRATQSGRNVLNTVCQKLLGA